MQKWGVFNRSVTKWETEVGRRTIDKKCKSPSLHSCGILLRMTQIILENQQRCAGISISVYSEKKPENLPELFDVTVKRHAQIIPLITDDLHIEETFIEWMWAKHNNTSFKFKT